MTRHLLIPVAAVLLVADTSSVSAHHSHPYFYDQCKTVSIVGRVDRVEFKNPHSIVVVTTDDGAAYTIDWNSLIALKRDGVIGAAQQALVVGARVAVAGNPIRTTAQIREHFPDLAGEVNPRTIDPRAIRRADDPWNWQARPNPNAAADCGK